MAPLLHRAAISRTETRENGNKFSDWDWNGNKSRLECGPMPNLMVALPNIGGALCSTPQRLADAHYYSAVQ